MVLCSVGSFPVTLTFFEDGVAVKHLKAIVSFLDPFLPDQVQSLCVGEFYKENNRRLCI